MFGPGVMNGEIMVAGGFNGSVNLSTVEKYNPATDSWSMLPMLGSPRRFTNILILLLYRFP